VTTAVLIVKVALAVMLLMAGTAKLAVIHEFARTVSLFAPGAIQTRRRLVGAIATAFAVCEVAIGALSLAFPRSTPVEEAVLGVTLTFVVASVLGFAFHRGASCRCFGHLSRKSFDATGIGKSVLIALSAAFVVSSTPGREATALTIVGHLLLLGTGALVAVATMTAVKELEASSETM